MAHALQVQHTGGPEVLSWTAVDVGEPRRRRGRRSRRPGRARSESRRPTPVLVEADRFALKDAADAHKALEARATPGSTVLTI